MLTNEHLKKMFYHYALHEEGEQVDIDETYVNDALIVAEMVKRIVNLKEESYYNPMYGANDDKLYIDGCTEYLSDEEKEAVMRFLGDSIWMQKTEETRNNEI